MNSEDPFEKRLQSQPVRTVPPSWREEILRTARAAAAPQPAPVEHNLSSPAILATWLRSLLWPHPRAWAGLAAVWLALFSLNLASREPSAQRMADRPVRPSPQMRELLRQQEQLLAELVGPIGTVAAERPKPVAPQPRSQRRDELMNA